MYSFVNVLHACNSLFIGYNYRLYWIALRAIHYPELYIMQTISNYPGLQPSLKLMDILSQSCQSDASAVDHSVAASLMSIQLGHHESLIQQLLTHSSALLEVVGALHTAIGERGVALPEDVGSKVKELGDRQRELRAQVQAEQQMPLISRKMEVCVQCVYVYMYML